LSKERIETCEISQNERIETCEICPKRELKCVRVLEREIDSIHVTRNASKKMRPHLKKELAMKNSKKSTSTHVAWVISSKSDTYVFGLFVEFTIFF
jgi:hypothetical protein